jgi:hypothetical protein
MQASISSKMGWRLFRRTSPAPSSPAADAASATSRLFTRACRESAARSLQTSVSDVLHAEVSPRLPLDLSWAVYLRAQEGASETMPVFLEYERLFCRALTSISL